MNKTDPHNSNLDNSYLHNTDIAFAWGKALTSWPEFAAAFSSISSTACRSPFAFNGNCKTLGKKVHQKKRPGRSHVVPVAVLRLLSRTPEPSSLPSLSFGLSSSCAVPWLYWIRPEYVIQGKSTQVLRQLLSALRIFARFPKIGYCFWRVFAQKVPRKRNGRGKERRGKGTEEERKRERKRQGRERERRKGKKGKALPEFWPYFKWDAVKAQS